MARTLIKLQNPVHWDWKSNKTHNAKIKIRSKLKRWLKKHCPGFVIMRQDIPPAVWIDTVKVDRFTEKWL